MKDLKKDKLNMEALKDVSGGAGEGLDMDSMQEHWNQIANNNVPPGARQTFDPEQMQEYWNEKVSENQSDSEPFFPHSKKIKGKLYK